MLFIAEKPDVAKAIAKAIGTNFSSKDGFMTDGKTTITWCFGHMMQLKDPEDYDEKYKKWNLDHIPFCFLPYQRKNNPATAKQLKVIKDLIKQATLIVNAGDPDDEGQLLVDEILREVKNRKPVKRILINDNNVNVVKKQLSSLEDNSKYEYMGYQAEARSVADQLFGYNLTRSYTIYNSAATGQKGLISIGRVQSAILGLIVRRDREHANHKKAYFYNVFADLIIDSTAFKAKFLPTDKQSVDEKNRLVDQQQADAIAAQCKDKQAHVIFSETVEKIIAPPLPYNLIKLQQDCAKKFDLNPSKTLQITQSLREKHQLITYNRSDCQYLSDEQHLDAANVLNCISHNLSGLSDVVENCNVAIKGRVFDSAKVSAHHAIIPTQTVVDFSKLTQVERNVYELIAVAYVAQFYPDYRYLQTKVSVDVDGHLFAVTSNIPTVHGWKVLFADDQTDDSDSDESGVDLRALKNGDLGICADTTVKNEVTKPQALYTMVTLLSDLTKVAKYIKDPALAKILKDRDKDKEGENGGIGTPATRDSIINTLFDRGYIIEQKKKIISTDIGQALYDQLSDRIRYPDLTALWTEKFSVIKNHDDVVGFINYLMAEHIKPEVDQIKQRYAVLKPHVSSNESVEKAPCPKCGRDMVLKNGKFGLFWACTGYFDKENQCKNMMKNVDGVPVENKTSQVNQSTESNTPIIFINVPFEDKDQVKALGARWNNDRKSWFIPSGLDQSNFSKWLSK